MQYTMQMTGAEATIGYLTFEPKEELTVSAALNYLGKVPFDEYMHKHLLVRLLHMPDSKLQNLAAGYPADPVFVALIEEAALQRPELAEMVPKDMPHRATPLVDLRQKHFPDMEQHRVWSKIFTDNLLNHEPLPEPADSPSLPYSRDTIKKSRQGFSRISQFTETISVPAETTNTPEEAIRRANEALKEAGVTLDRQMLHQSSLSPVGLVRNWSVEVTVKNGSLDYQLCGQQSSFGRGLEFNTAEAGLLMEICERFSSWASFSPEGACGYRSPIPLIRSRYSELSQIAVNPATLPLEVPDGDEPLHWVQGVQPDGSKILVPAQFTFLLSNLDEPALASGLGSTGLGAGLDMNRARVAALLEIIERDAESVSPHRVENCFRIESENKELNELLGKYRKKGIEIYFEDITPELGVPCYRAFAIGPEGQVTKGASAGLNGAEACVSAMLEIPYPYPWGPPTRPAPEGLPIRVIEDLPNYSTGGFAGDLALLESALTASNLTPVYVDLTREDMNIPVCRAIIPGLELMADFDRNSRLSPRLFANLLKD